jgi:hypothetical protein
MKIIIHVNTTIFLLSVAILISGIIRAARKKLTQKTKCTLSCRKKGRMNPRSFFRTCVWYTTRRTHLAAFSPLLGGGRNCLFSNLSRVSPLLFPRSSFALFLNNSTLVRDQGTHFQFLGDLAYSFYPNSKIKVYRG